MNSDKPGLFHTLRAWATTPPGARRRLPAALEGAEKMELVLRD